jgi:hypothetical protein
MKTAHYTAQTYQTIDSLRKYKTELNFISDSDQTLVVDIYDCGDASLDSWVAKLKSTATVGSIFAYDHRLDGAVAPNLPSVSIMFEAIHGTADLAEAVAVAGNSSYFAKLADSLTTRELAAVVSDEQLELTQSNRLLNLAAAF